MAQFIEQRLDYTDRPNVVSTLSAQKAQQAQRTMCVPLTWPAMKFSNIK